MCARNSLSFKTVFCLALLSLASIWLSGCLVPEAAPLLGHEVKKRLMYDVIRGVQCEIRHAVLSEIRQDRAGVWGGRKLEWLERWDSLIDLDLTVDDTVAFNPGVSFLTPNLPYAHLWRASDLFVDPNKPSLVEQSYNFGIGGGVSYEVRRLDKVQFGYDFSKFVDFPENLDAPCYHIGGVTLDTDLKLKDWLDDVLEPVKQCAFLGEPLKPGQAEIAPFTRVMQNMEDIKSEIPPDCFGKDLSKEKSFPKTGPVKSFSHDVAFILMLDINATPNWKLIRVSTSNNKLIDASRKDTSDLLITLAPPAAKEEPAVKGVRGGKAKSGRDFTLGVEALLTHQALQIGLAVRQQQ